MGLHAAFDGYRIAILADFHCLPGVNLGVVRHAIDVAIAQKPDLAILLGDYAASFEHRRGPNRWLYERGFAALAPELRRLRPPDGVIAVVGNHDHYHDADATRRWLEGLGARVLVNEHLLLRRGAGVLRIGGVDDAREGDVDPRRALGTSPDAPPTILLSHNPDGVLSLTPDVRADVVLSGHTHGGQVVLPFVGAPITHSRVCRRHTAAGWVPNAHAPLFVSRGIAGQIPMRFNCPPELPIARLRAADTPLDPKRPELRRS